SERDAAAWEDLSEDKQDELDLRMAIYAAQVDRMDQGVGRVVDVLRELDELENTLLLFLIDNGGCAEGGEFGGGPSAQLETKQGYWLTYGRAWANASNTPFRRYKHWVHEGGIASPLIAHWPRGIEARGELRADPAHLIDLMATCVDVSGATYPDERDGHRVPAMEGLSLLPAFASGALAERTLFWEHEGNAAVRDGDWKLVARQGSDWELYNLAEDRSEVVDLVHDEADRARELFARYQKWSRRVGVLPFPVRRPAGYAPPTRSYAKTWVDLAKEATVRIVVTTPDSAGPLFLSGAFNEWGVDDLDWQLSRGIEERQWWIEFDSRALRGSEFKFQVAPSSDTSSENQSLRAGPFTLDLKPTGEALEFQVTVDAWRVD
ncbi:MAG: hypothetical protein ACI835_004303, partial [Planctomycetota bacterium]